tara:strand:+ start:294 stop:497 length:204 start_codon:yes stop_codon:yes gene_type:complete
MNSKHIKDIIDNDILYIKYMNDFYEDLLEEFISFLSKLGNNKKKMKMIFSNEKLFDEFYTAFLESQD